MIKSRGTKTRISGAKIRKLARIWRETEAAGQRKLWVYGSIRIGNNERPVTARQIYRNKYNFVVFIGICESNLYTTIN